MSTEELRGRAARMSAATTQVEHELSPHRPIVTKTDLKGKITSANPAFVEISGFTHEELIGQPHNVVRHPDMPRAVFKFLWERILDGHEAFAYVNNLARNGDNYWVLPSAFGLHSSTS